MTLLREPRPAGPG